MIGFRRLPGCVVALACLFPLTAHSAPPEVAKDEELFRELDVSEDGVLTGREAKEYKKYDADGDQRVTLAEFLAGRAKERGGSNPLDDEELFKKLDTNMDGVLSGKERKGYLQFDTDGDGEISKAEFLAGRRKSAAPVQTPANRAGLQTYQNLQEKLSPRHIQHFVPFKFSFPAGWKYDKNAGTEASSNMVKVERAIDRGTEGTFTQENFAVGYFDSPPNSELVKAMTEAQCEQLQRQIKAGFTGVKMNDARKLQFGAYAGYGFDFSFRLAHTTKKEIDAWGRVILISGETLKQPHGLTVIMLATAEAPELKSLDDLGVKGELPAIIKSFTVEGAPGKPKTEAPPAPPAPPTP